MKKSLLKSLFLNILLFLICLIFVKANQIQDNIDKNLTNHTLIDNMIQLNLTQETLSLENIDNSQENENKNSTFTTKSI